MSLAVSWTVRRLNLIAARARFGRSMCDSAPFGVAPVDFCRPMRDVGSSMVCICLLLRGWFTIGVLAFGRSTLGALLHPPRLMSHATMDCSTLCLLRVNLRSTVAELDVLPMP